MMRGGGGSSSSGMSSRTGSGGMMGRSGGGGSGGGGGGGRGDSYGSSSRSNGGERHGGGHGGGGGHDSDEGEMYDDYDGSMEVVYRSPEALTFAAGLSPAIAAMLREALSGTGALEEMEKEGADESPTTASQFGDMSTVPRAPVSVTVHTPSGRRALGDLFRHAVNVGEPVLSTVRREIFHSLLPTARAVARGRVSNFFFQDLYRQCTHTERMDILRNLFLTADMTDSGGDRTVLLRDVVPPVLEGMLPREAWPESVAADVRVDLAFVRDLATDKHGTRAMQLMVAEASTPAEQRILLGCVMPLVGVLGTSRGGCHVLMGFLRAQDSHWPDAYRSRVAQAIADHADDVSMNRYGSRVVQHLLEGSAGGLPVIENIAEHVAARTPAWVRHDSANFLVSTLFWNASRFQRQAEAAAAVSVLGHVFDLVRDRCGSHVVQAALGSQLLPKTRLAIMEELCAPETAAQVVVNRFANYVAQAAIRAAAGNEHARRLVATLYLAACLSPPTAGPGPRCVKDQFERAFPDFARDIMPTPGTGAIPPLVTALGVAIPSIMSGGSSSSSSSSSSMGGGPRRR
jgi:Pumilio-family RNA binding repeat